MIKPILSIAALLLCACGAAPEGVYSTTLDGGAQAAPDAGAAEPLTQSSKCPADEVWRPDARACVLVGD